MDRVVLDAGIGVMLVLPTATSGPAERLLQRWLEAGVERSVPTLWEYEVVSALRKYVAAGLVSHEQAVLALDELSRIGVRTIPPDRRLHEQALVWAGKLGQFVAYDGAYLALAEQLGAEFWTTDRRLAAQADGLGVNWVRLALGTESADR